MKSYVVVIYNRWEEGSIDALVGTYGDLKSAQAARERIQTKIGGYRPISILTITAECEIPEWVFA